MQHEINANQALPGGSIELAGSGWSRCHVDGPADFALTATVVDGSPVVVAPVNNEGDATGRSTFVNAGESFVVRAMSALTTVGPKSFVRFTRHESCMAPRSVAERERLAAQPAGPPTAPVLNVATRKVVV